MGVVSFKNVRLRYRSDLSDALKGVTFCTKPTEKVGIVGRTGSGKSSLFQALFRINEIHQGDIKVDGNSIKYLDLKEIRYGILKFLCVNCRLMIVNCQWGFFVQCLMKNIMLPASISFISLKVIFAYFPF